MYSAIIIRCLTRPLYLIPPSQPTLFPAPLGLFVTISYWLMLSTYCFNEVATTLGVSGRLGHAGNRRDGAPAALVWCGAPVKTWTHTCNNFLTFSQGNFLFAHRIKKRMEENSARGVVANCGTFNSQAVYVGMAVWGCSTISRVGEKKERKRECAQNFHSDFRRFCFFVLACYFFFVVLLLSLDDQRPGSLAENTWKNKMKNVTEANVKFRYSVLYCKGQLDLGNQQEKTRQFMVEQNKWSFFLLLNTIIIICYNLLILDLIVITISVVVIILILYSYNFRMKYREVTTSVIICLFIYWIICG